MLVQTQLNQDRMPQLAPSWLFALQMQIKHSRANEVEYFWK
jgi:hypothetical protein